MGVVAKGAVRSPFVVEVEEAGEIGFGLGLGAVALEVNLVVFDRPPEPFDEDVVQRTAAAVHRQLHPEGEQRLGKLGGRELAALIGVEDLRHAIAVDRPLHRPGAEARVQGV